MDLIDSSALLALILGERGGTKVAPAVEHGVMASVNYGETVTALINRGWGPSDATSLVESFALHVVPVEKSDAVLAGEWRAPTRHLGLSIGDRICLAVGFRLGATVLTADKAWGGLSLGVKVLVIR